MAERCSSLEKVETGTLSLSFSLETVFGSHMIKLFRLERVFGSLVAVIAVGYILDLCYRKINSQKVPPPPRPLVELRSFQDQQSEESKVQLQERGLCVYEREMGF